MAGIQFLFYEAEKHFNIPSTTIRINTAKKLRNKLKSVEVSYGTIYTDKWDSFISVFQEDNHIIGKKHTQGIEGNNCCLRHRIRRAFRKTWCF